ncbi:MAG: C_GCAxxG_C_C family protein [Parasporobacterium sp.]|nr:C_GCAxxG_C_C family protein [Parasporobacterium sp.]
MLKDNIDRYYFDGNFNCAESLMLAANDYYDLKMTEKEIRAVGGFGAGMQTGNVCGALLAAISVLSELYIEKKAHESEDIKPVVTMLTDRFTEAFGGTILCKDVKYANFVEGKRCHKTVTRACDVLEKVITEYERGMHRSLKF